MFDRLTIPRRLRRVACAIGLSLAAGAGPTLADTPLHLAAFDGDLAAVKRLVEAGASVDRRAVSGSTALMVAAAGGHEEVVRYLVSRGARINRQNEHGWTALMLAINGRHGWIATFLLGRGADTELATRDGRTAVTLAEATGFRGLNEARIAGLLNRASAQLKAFKLTSPSGDNALDSYNQILAIDADNAKARAGLNDIADAYERLAQRAKGRGQTGKAKGFVEKGVGIVPEHPGLNALAAEMGVVTAATIAAREAAEKAAAEAAAREKAAAEAAAAQAEAERLAAAARAEEARQTAAAQAKRERLAAEAKAEQERLAAEAREQERIRKAAADLLAEARQLEAAGKLQESLETARRAASTNPADTALRDYADAIAARLDEQERQAAALAALLADGERFLAAGALIAPPGDNALATYRAVLDMEPGNTTAQAQIEVVAEQLAARIKGLDQAGRLDDAGDAAAKALDAFPQNQTLMDLGRNLHDRSEQVSALLAEARSRRELGNLAAPAGSSALDSYRAVQALHPANRAAEIGIQGIETAYLERVDRLLERSDLPQADTALTEAIAAFPDNAEFAGRKAQLDRTIERTTALVAQGEARLAEGRLAPPDADNALSSFRSALKFDPANRAAQLGIDRVHDEFLREAQTLDTADQPDEALALVARAQAAFPDSQSLQSLQNDLRRKLQAINTKLELARQQLLAGRFTQPPGDNAVESYRGVLKQDPDNSAALAGLDELADRYVTLARQKDAEGELDASLQLLREAIGALGERPAFSELRASLVAKAGNRRAADEHTLIATRLLEQGDVDGSEAEVRKGLGLVPNDAALLALADKLQNRRVALEAQNARNEQLLSDAEAALGNTALTRDAIRPVIDQFRQVLVVEPENKRAQNGLNAISANFALAARQAELDNQLESSLSLLEDGLHFFPRNAALADGHERIKTEIEQRDAKAQRIATLLATAKQARQGMESSQAEAEGTLLSLREQAQRELVQNWQPRL